MTLWFEHQKTKQKKRLITTTHGYYNLRVALITVVEMVFAVFSIVGAMMDILVLIVLKLCVQIHIVNRTTLHGYQHVYIVVTMEFV